MPGVETQLEESWWVSGAAGVGLCLSCARKALLISQIPRMWAGVFHPDWEMHSGVEIGAHSPESWCLLQKLLVCATGPFHYGPWPPGVRAERHVCVWLCVRTCDVYMCLHLCECMSAYVCVYVCMWEGG